MRIQKGNTQFKKKKKKSLLSLLYWDLVDSNVLLFETTQECTDLKHQHTRAQKNPLGY